MPPKPSAEDAALAARVAALPGDVRERCRQALAQLRRDGRAVSVRALRAAAGVDTGACALLLRAWRQGLLNADVAWDSGAAPAPGPAPAPPGSEPLAALVAAIELARGPGELAAVARQAASLVAQRALDPATARALKDLLTEGRRAAADAARGTAAAAGPEALVSAEAVLLAQLFDGLASGRRRAELLERARALAAEDAAAFPGTDPQACVAQLALERLDAFGQPLVDPPPAT